MAVQDEKVKDAEGTTFQAKFAQWLSPFQISFVIFWVICNYDFLLILVGKKAILHDIYAHFGYGCVVSKKYVACNDPWLPFNWHLPYALRFILYSFYWKVAIPIGLTLGYMLIYYPKLVAPLNKKYENTGNDVLKKMVSDEVDKKIERMDRERMMEEREEEMMDRERKMVKTMERWEQMRNEMMEMKRLKEDEKEEKERMKRKPLINKIP